MASHIGKLPIAIPAGVEVKIEGQNFSAKGAKGSDSYVVPEGITAAVEGNEIVLTAADDLRPTRAKHGLARSIMAGMVKGVHDGYSNPPEGITLKVTDANHVVVEGTDKQVVGQVAANIRKLRAPEPYKGKGIKYSDERILRKAGKAGK